MRATATDICTQPHTIEAKVTVTAMVNPDRAWRP